MSTHIATAGAVAESATSSFSLKGLLGFLTAGIFTVCGIDAQLLIILCVLILLDSITGIIKAHKQKKPITSGGLKATVVKIFLYGITLITINLLAILLLRLNIDLTFTVFWLAGFLAIVEVKSILENITESGVLLPKWLNDKIRSLFNQLNNGKNPTNTGVPEVMETTSTEEIATENPEKINEA